MHPHAPTTYVVNPKTAYELLQNRDFNVDAFAKDVVLYGASDYEGVILAHGLAVEEADLVKQLPEYKSAAAALQKHLKTSPYAKVRYKALEFLESSLEAMHVSALKSGDLSHIAKAVKVFAEVADALPQEDKTSTAQAPTLVVNIGGLRRDQQVQRHTVVDAAYDE